MTPQVTIRKTDRELLTFTNVAVATDVDHAKHITNLVIAMNDIPMEDIKVAEYGIDGKMVFAYLLQRVDGKMVHIECQRSQN